MINRVATQILEYAKQAKKIAITTHIAIDGDGFAACLALQEILWHYGFENVIVTDDDDLFRYQFLLENSQLLRYESGQVFDLVIVLDCNSYDRLGQRKELVDSATNVIVLDHHIVDNSPINSVFSYIDHKYVSVGAIIYRAFEQDISKMNNATYIVTCLWVTILNDTNNFTNANTDKAVMQMATDMLSYPIQPYKIHKEFMLNQTANQMLYVGKTLATISLKHNEKFLFMHSSLQMQEECGINPDGFVSITRYVQGVNGLDAIAYFREEADGWWKLSLRSPKLNVQEIVAKYQGGGHQMAAGCRMKGTLSEIEAVILQDLINGRELKH